MSKILRVGDPHYRVSTQAELAALMTFVEEKSVEFGVDRIELLGDLNHNNSIVRVEALEFWRFWIDRLSKDRELVVLVGNHDLRNQEDNGSHSLSDYHLFINPWFHLIDQPTRLGSFAYLPYIKDVSKFVEAANRLYDEGARVLVCHEDFNGAKYESGIYIPNGVDLDKLKYDVVISGHIHSQQKFGKLSYIGTPRWMDNNDINLKKGIWVFEHDDATGAVLSETFIDTSTVCQPLLGLQWKEGEPQPEIAPNSRTTVELIGTSTWVSKQKSKLRGKAGIKTKITDKPNAERRKVGNSLVQFVQSTFEPTNGVSKDAILKYMEELGLVGPNT